MQRSEPSGLGGPLPPLAPRSDLTYRTLEGLEFQNADVNQSLFTGSLLRNCRFVAVTFDRSDLDGIKIERSTFEGCSFNMCDIRSSHMAGSRFVRCDFGNTFIDDCELDNSELENCSFSGAIIRKCRFRASGLSECSFTPGTLLHNKFYDCAITATTLGDCTFLYTIMRDCRLEGVRLNAESIGAVFGLAPAQVLKLALIYLGQHQSVPDHEDVVRLIVEEYERRGWYIGQLVHDLNYGLRSVVGAFQTYFVRARQRFLTLGFAKGDELQFISDILDELAQLERLPLMTAIDIHRWSAEVGAALQSSEPQRNSGEALRSLAARATVHAQALFEKLEGVLVDPVQHERVALRATFDREPAVPVHRLLADVTATLLPEGPQTTLVRSESGSYIEIVLTSLFSVAALQAFVFLVNGTLIQVTELKHRIRILALKRPPKAYRDLALAPTQQASPSLLNLLTGLTQYARGVGWLHMPTVGGYSAPNLRALEVLDSDTVSERSPD